MTFAIVDSRLLRDGAPVADLPRRPVPVRVQVWSVPADYRADGLFVTAHGPGEPEEVPGCDPRASRLLATLDCPADPGAELAERQAALCARITVARDRRLTGGVLYAGRRFDTDAHSVRRIAGAVQLVALDPTFATDWIAADNALVHLDAAALIGLGQAVAAQEAALIFAARQAKDAVLAAPDADAAQAAADGYLTAD